MISPKLSTLLFIIQILLKYSPGSCIIFIHSDQLGARLCFQIPDNLSACSIVDAEESTHLLERYNPPSFPNITAPRIVTANSRDLFSFSVRFENGNRIHNVSSFIMMAEGTKVDIDLMETGTSYYIACFSFGSFSKVSSNIIQWSSKNFHVAHGYPHLSTFSELNISKEEMQSGRFTCRSTYNKNHAETLRIFTQRSEEARKSTFVSVRELTIQKDETGFIVPCRTNYRLETPPKLLLDSLTELNAEQLKSFSWDPSVGFRFNSSEHMWEMRTLDCFHLSHKFFRPTPTRFEDSIIVKAEGHQISCRPGTRSSYLQLAGYKSTYKNARYHGCNTYLECDLNLASGIHLDESSYREYLGHTFAMRMLDSKKTFGVLSCRLDHVVNGTTAPEISSRLFFLGLDSNVYLLPGPYPNSSVIQISQVDQLIYKSQAELYYEFSCTTINFVRSSGVYLILRHKDLTETVAQNDSRRQGSEQSSESGFNVTLQANITHAICLMITTEGRIVSAERSLNIVDGSAPVIDNATNNYKTFKVGAVNDDPTLHCPITGVPQPSYRWVFDEKGAKLVHGIHTRTLVFRQIQEILAGSYTCIAWNQFGNNSFEFQVSVQPEITTQIHSSVRPQVRVPPKVSDQPETSVRPMISDRPEASVRPRVSVQSTDGLQSQELSNTLSGTTISWIAFAAVLFFILFCAVVVLGYKYVSAKRQIRNLTPEEALEFLNGIPMSEGISADVGCELALNLPFTKCIESNSLVVVREALLGKGQSGIVYKGTLHDEEVAVKTFKRAVTYEEFRAVLIEVKLMHFVGEHPNIVKFIGADVTNIEKRCFFVVMELSPIGSLEKHLGMLKTSVYTNYAAGTTASQYTKADERLTQVALLGFCEQIASAMEHLECKRVIHGDLAARNVLVFSHGVVKVTDFGYSRQLYENTMYQPKKTRALPWRWASIELLRKMEFSTEADVWAFGVTVWEIFTFGNLPFPSDKWNEQFMDSLEKGLRLLKPPGLSEAQYAFLGECWNMEKSIRPKFSTLRSFFSTEKKNLQRSFESSGKVITLSATCK